jgi:hypothetical protein
MRYVTHVKKSCRLTGTYSADVRMVPGDRIAPRVYMLSTCPWRRDEFAVCESNGLDSGVV